MGQRGATLLELTVAVAIAAVAAAAFCGLSPGSRVLGAAAASGQFDASLAYARALAAASGNGATLVFRARTGSAGLPLPGFVLAVYSGRPTAAGAMTPAVPAPVETGGEVSEAKLGAVPFTVFLDGAGHASAMTGAVSTNSVIASDPGCPSGESAVTLTFSDPHASTTRAIACTPP